jgi:hypothetical protein
MDWFAITHLARDALTRFACMFPHREDGKWLKTTAVSISRLDGYGSTPVPNGTLYARTPTIAF